LLPSSLCSGVVQRQTSILVTVPDTLQFIAECEENYAQYNPLRTTITSAL
jgi:hypothetical protein